MLLADGNPALVLSGVCLGVVMGRHIENSGHAMAYSGAQFTLAVLVTLVPDCFREVAVTPALDRLVGILLGIATLGPILVAWHLVTPLGPEGSK